MKITSITGTPPEALPIQAMGSMGQAPSEELGRANRKPDEVARQFEAILVRQMLSESMKGLLEHGKEGQVYGYFLTDALAEGITKGGGLGIRSIIEAQLRLRESDGSPRSDL